MRRAALLGVLLALLLVGGASADWGPGDPHWSLWFNRSNTQVNLGSHASLDDVPSGGVMTFEMWLRYDPVSAATTEVLASKSNFSNRGWSLGISSGDKPTGYVYLDTTNALYINHLTLRDGLWHHIAMTFDDATHKTYISVDGVWSQETATTGAGAYNTDADQTMYAGYRSGQAFGYGGIAWYRYSDSERYTPGVSFTPPIECPIDDANTVGIWCVDEGTGSTIHNTGGPAPHSDRDGTASNHTWESFDTQVIRENLVSWWSLEQNTGTRLDSHGGQDLTDNNTVSRNTGKLNYAADFNAATYEYLSREDGSAVSTGDISYTVGAWVYMDVVTDSTIIGKGDEYALRYDTNHFEFLTGNGVTTETVAAATPAPAATTTWYWLAGYHDRDNATIGIYRNTTLNSEAYVNGGHDGDQALYVARRGDLYLDGRVDEAVVFKGWVPNHDENAWFYNGGSGRSYSDLPMPTPTPTPTPVPTPTPSPTPITSAVYLASLPSGGVGVVSASVSAGEAMIVVVGLLLLFLLLYRTLSEKVRLWWTTR